MADIINTSDGRVFGEDRKSVISTVRAAVVNNLQYLLVDRKFDAERGVTIHPDFLKKYRAMIADTDAQDMGSLDPSNVSTIRWSLLPLPINPRTASFIDLGSGTGRALLVAADYHFKHVIGVEQVAELHEAANENLGQLSEDFLRCSWLENRLGDATAYALPVDNLVIYLNNDWSATALDKILSHVKFSFNYTPRSIFIIYVNPVKKHVFDRYSFLQPLKLRFWARMKLKYLCPHKVMIYRA
jgi:SAM-dependent methyltransferase